VLKEIHEPSEVLQSELQRLQAEAKALAVARDNAKPKEVRENEMRSKFRTMQAKLEANVQRKSVLEADIKELEGKLAKQQAALSLLEATCMDQDKKVRELHTALGTVCVDSDSKDASGGGESDMDEDTNSRRRDGWGLVGKKGRVATPAALTEAEKTVIALLTGKRLPNKPGEGYNSGELRDGSVATRDGRSRPPRGREGC
jgi:predicted RNase H-like nuclease (RuvC/YqgF family)